MIHQHLQPDAIGLYARLAAKKVSSLKQSVSHYHYGLHSIYCDAIPDTNHLLDGVLIDSVELIYQLLCMTQSFDLTRNK
jgi:hypothetical protein